MGRSSVWVEPSERVLRQAGKPMAVDSLLESIRGEVESKAKDPKATLTSSLSSHPSFVVVKTDAGTQVALSAWFGSPKLWIELVRSVGSPTSLPTQGRPLPSQLTVALEGLRPQERETLKAEVDRAVARDFSKDVDPSEVDWLKKLQARLQEMEAIGPGEGRGAARDQQIDLDELRGQFTQLIRSLGYEDEEGNFAISDQAATPDWLDAQIAKVQDEIQTTRATANADIAKDLEGIIRAQLAQLFTIVSEAKIAAAEAQGAAAAAAERVKAVDDKAQEQQRRSLTVWATMVAGGSLLVGVLLSVIGLYVALGQRR